MIGKVILVIKLRKFKGISTRVLYRGQEYICGLKKTVHNYTVRNWLNYTNKPNILIEYSICHVYFRNVFILSAFKNVSFISVQKLLKFKITICQFLCAISGYSLLLYNLEVSSIKLSTVLISGCKKD